MAGTLKTSLGAIAVVVVGGIAFWLTEAGGSEWVIGLLKRPTVIVESTSRGDASPYLAGEVLRFTLKGASPDRVLWDFEDKEIQPGNVQIEHAFPFDSSESRGIQSKHRIDVFYEESGVYRWASRFVDVNNAQIVQAKVVGDNISLEKESDGTSGWSIDQVSLSKFRDGKFQPQTPLADNGGGSTTVNVGESALKQLGINFGPHFDPDNAKGAVATMTFVTSNGQHLKTAFALDNQIRELQLKMATHQQ